MSSLSGPRGGSADTRAFRLAVLASGNGSNLQAIIDQLHLRPGRPRIEVALVLSDVPGAHALERARQAGIPTAVFAFDPDAPLDDKSREEHDLAMAAAVREAEADLVVLAGYMRLLCPAFVEAFPYRIINLHPALLPAFPGTTSISDALEYGVKVTGATVHFVDAGLDTGPIIAQVPVRVKEDDVQDTLAARIHAVEHRLLPLTIRLIAGDKVKPPLPGSRVVHVDWDDEELTNDDCLR